MPSLISLLPAPNFKDLQQKCERTSLDIGQLVCRPPSKNAWKFCYMAADDIEPQDSDWSKAVSTPGIYVLGKRVDRFYEIAIDELYIPWLFHHKFQFLNSIESKAITDKDIDRFYIANLIGQMMTFLPIGLQPDLGLPTKALVQLPLSQKICIQLDSYTLSVKKERNTEASNIILLGGGVYECEKGCSGQKLGNRDMVSLQLGGVVTRFVFQRLTHMPSPSEEVGLVTLSIDYDGWYEDHKGAHCLSDKVLRVIQTMKVGQKVLIIANENGNLGVEKKDRRKEMRICLHVSHVLASHTIELLVSEILGRFCS
ncbi:hypothetical protein SBOR_1017 [Sclerotinia borealis F-4128]|uniref:Uncharacterized protein n=1 Tax=Sclerotinia borealis (strain F-4128) TaxID=1432307 RepID=W9CP21_SCLBF|nr:hypothetical protein SBOR_1017 [Sclerotinia borealis F-4128]